MRKRSPHCASAYHFQRCECRHERQYHLGEKLECGERGCPCEEFRLAKGYPDEAHQTKPNSYQEERP